MTDFVAEFMQLYRSGRFAEADARAADELVARPDDPEVLRLAGMLKMELRQSDAALALLTRVCAQSRAARRGE